MSTSSFPFALEDIAGWVVKRKDGSVVKFSLIDPIARDKKITIAKPQTGLWTSYSGYKDWCKHEPHPATDKPIFLSENIGLWIADSIGARNSYKEFDVCIDGGNVLTVPGEHDLPNIYGDPYLRSKLAEHVVVPAGGWQTTTNSPRIVKLRWFDRAAPPVYPSFWPALLDELKLIQSVEGQSPLRVLTICQGGHGRSGTALVSLMMCLTDYTPLEALSHIRALHCARAIESKDQHEYLNLVAKELGRKEDALDAEKVSSFKDYFLALTNPWAASYKERLQSGGGAKVTDRDSAFC